MQQPLAVVREVAAIGPGIALFGYGLRNFAKDLESRAWPTVDGQIEAVRRTHVKGVLYIQLKYQYSVRGQRYVGTRWSFGWPRGMAMGMEAETFVKQHPRGSTLTVYYNPEDHGQALIVPGPSLGHLLVFAISLVFVGMGLLALHG